MLKSFFILMSVVITAFIIIIMMARYMGLKTEHTWPSHQFQRGPFEIIAHRGGGLEAPENTIPAFDHAAQLFNDIILEMDVHLSKDGHLVVIHDETVDRTTDGKGKVSDLSLAELQKLDAGYHYQDAQGQYAYRRQGLQIPTLEEILERYPQRRMTIELKAFTTQAVKAFIDIIIKFNASEYITIASYSHRVVEYIRSQHPDWIFAATSTEMYQSLILLNMFLEPIDPIRADSYYIPEVSTGIPVLSKRLLKEMHRRGKPVFIWTVNDKKNMKKLIEFGVDGIVTDRPSLLLDIINEEVTP